MSLWHRVKVRLGLEDEWDDEEYYEDDDYYEPKRRSLSTKNAAAITTRHTAPARIQIPFAE